MGGTGGLSHPTDTSHPSLPAMIIRRRRRRKRRRKKRRRRRRRRGEEFTHTRSFTLH